MNEKHKTRNIIILVGILITFSLIFFIINKMNEEKDEREFINYIKDYKINEYIPTYVSDSDMAKIYLNDYVYIMYSDVEKAYNLLDEEYRNKKFGSIDAFTNYVNSLTYTSYKMDSYYIDNVDGYKIFGIYDKNGNLFIFKTKGVMQYTVYLDSDTVEI